MVSPTGNADLQVGRLQERRKVEGLPSEARRAKEGDRWQVATYRSLFTVHRSPFTVH
jgi:hypothetical protein